MRTFEEYRKRFADLYAAVKKGHEKSPNKYGGHGFDHDVAVAQMGALIAPDGHTADKAWVAGLLHSTDRYLRDDDLLPSVLRELMALVDDHLFSRDDREEILLAVLRHDQKNQEDDSLTQQVLMDADRLINLQPLVIARGAQHYHDVPAIELDHLGKLNPASTFRRPCNSLDNMRHVLEWIPWLRLPEAKRRGAELAKYIEDYIRRAEHIYHELGLAGVKL